MISEGVKMVFSSSIFVFLFLPTTLLLYFLAEKSNRNSLKNTVVLLASLVFYLWGGVKYLILLLFLVIVNYVIGLLIENTNYKKIFLIIGLAIDILDLVFFKYLNFILYNLEKVIHKIIDDEFSFGVPQIVLPIGISFFTFQIMSYLIDVYRREVPAQKNVAKLGLYIMMFPQLIAGPIVRYSDVNKEIDERKTSFEMLESGLKRFIIGFAKKVFIANSMGSMADAVFKVDGQVNTIYAWIGAVCYTMQIFFDFSAYSDMAIGLGRVFGFHFNENFNYPYISKSIKEFWRRWHISLSTWFRDYVYIPLGGNRKGVKRTYINLSIVFLLTGIWHGAAWQFIVWGAIHGFFLILERGKFGELLNKLPNIIKRIYTLLIVVVGWVFFRAESLGKAVFYLKNMFVINLQGVANVTIVMEFTNMFLVMSAVAILASTPLFQKIGAAKLFNIEWLNRACYLVLWFISVIYMVGLSYNPFIYFQF